MSELLSLEQAQHKLIAGVESLGSETVAVEDALGRILAEDVQAARTQPPADLSAMDGFAMRSGEAGPWKVIGESAAGHPFDGSVGSGEAIRISTGAQMPDGAGAVLLQENATREGDTLTLNGEGEPTANHIRRAGFDFRQGDKVLDQGQKIGPARLALAIAAGHGSLKVNRQPNIAIIDSGDELSSDPSQCGESQIPASNGPMLSAMCKPLVSKCRRLGPVPDRLDALVEALEHAGNAHVIVTSGGASVGDHDLVKPALEAWGAEIDFWKVAMKPGKPLLVARKDEQVILGLPGNPVSSFVTAYFFLLPLLKVFAGSSSPLPTALPIPCTEDLPKVGSRLEFVRARVDCGNVSPLSEQDSSALRSLAAADALIERPAGADAVKAGTPVPVHLLENGGIA